MRAKLFAVGLLAALSGCAGLPEYAQGPLQPQAVTGPCRVKPFFLLAFRSVPVELDVVPTGEPCTLLLINPALNVVVNAALLTEPARRGQAAAGVVNGARQATVSYLPAPGQTGTDRFGVTLEPNAVGLTVNVTVRPTLP